MQEMSSGGPFERLAGSDPPLLVLLLHSSDELYGADRIILQVAGGLDRSIFRPVVILPDDIRDRGLLGQELGKQGIEFYYAPIAVMRRKYLRPIGILKLLVRVVRGTLSIRRLVRRNAGRVVLYGFTFPVIAAPLAAWILSIPLVVHCHEILERPSFLRKAMHALNVRGALSVICVSKAVRFNILQDEAAAKNRVLVVYNGLSDHFSSGLTKSELRTALGADNNIPIVGMIGRVTTWKGQEVLLMASALLRDRGVKLHSVTIGGVFDNESQHMKRLLQRRQDLGMEELFKIIDFLPDARSMITAFDVFVSPSTRPDPFPTVILEAMSNGIPVIASRHGGPLEMVLDGITGLFFESGNAEDLANAIESLLFNPSKCLAMGFAGRRRLKETFTFPAQMSSIKRILLSAAEGTRGELSVGTDGGDLPPNLGNS